tara:strand:+ start:782 stop:1432 length:651 start_codon:yes stop_codon:yes gene_type:complete
MSHITKQSSGYRTGVQFPAEQLTAAVEATVGPHGFEDVTEQQIDEYHQLADELIEGEIAGPDALWRVQSWTGCALQLRRSNGVANALLASIPLTASGRDALLDGRFGFSNAEREWVCGPTDRAEALLSWGMAGRTPLDQIAALRGLLAGWYAFYPDIRVYARARSAQGQKLMTRLGFEPIRQPEGAPLLFGSTGFPHRMAQKLAVRDGIRVEEGFA